MIRNKLIRKGLKKRRVQAHLVRLWTKRMLVYSVCRRLMWALKRTPTVSELALTLRLDQQVVQRHLISLNGAAGLPYSTIIEKQVPTPKIDDIEEATQLPLEVDTFFMQRLGYGR